MPHETKTRTRSSTAARKTSTRGGSGTPRPSISSDRTLRTPKSAPSASRRKISSANSVASSHKSYNSQHRRSHRPHSQKARHHQSPSTPQSDVGSTVSSLASVSVTKEGREPMKTPRRGGSFREDSPARKLARNIDHTPRRDNFNSVKRAIEGKNFPEDGLSIRACHAVQRRLDGIEDIDSAPHLIMSLFLYFKLQT